MIDEQLKTMREYARRPASDAKDVRVVRSDGDVLEGIAVFVSDAERDVISSFIRVTIRRNTRLEGTIALSD